MAQFRLSFLALDFETANSAADSACAIGLVRVKDGIIVEQVAHLIRPPTPFFEFTPIHGINWGHVFNEVTFGELWPRIASYFEGNEFIAAHNVGFDRRVLLACAAKYGVQLPVLNYRCSMLAARSQLGIYPTKLSDVCRKLSIPLNHHDALSDALACAKIILAASEREVGSAHEQTANER